MLLILSPVFFHEANSSWVGVSIRHCDEFCRFLFRIREMTICFLGIAFTILKLLFFYDFFGADCFPNVIRTPLVHPSPPPRPHYRARSRRGFRPCLRVARNQRRARRCKNKKNARAALGNKKPAVEEPAGKAEENKRAAQSSAFVISSPAWLGLK